MPFCRAPPEKKKKKEQGFVFLVVSLCSQTDWGRKDDVWHIYKSKECSVSLVRDFMTVGAFTLIV